VAFFEMTVGTAAGGLEVEGATEAGSAAALVVSAGGSAKNVVDGLVGIGIQIPASAVAMKNVGYCVHGGEVVALVRNQAEGAEGGALVMENVEGQF